MSCDAVNDLLTRESGRIGKDVYDRVVSQSPWIRMTKRGQFPEGMGSSINVYTFERTMPSGVASQTWSDVDPSDGDAGGACLQTDETISFGQTLRSFNLQRYAINTPDICVEDLRTNWQVREQVAQMVDMLSQVTDFVWTNRHRSEYQRIVPKIYVNAALTKDTTQSATLNNANLPTSYLTQPVLNRLYMELIREGAGRDGIGMSNGVPQFALVTDAETSLDLIRKNSDIREDWRYADAPELLKPLGVSRSYQGFFHVCDTLPFRYDYVGGAWVQRQPYASEAATKGLKWEIQSTYLNAEYTVSYIYHPAVLECLVPRPFGSAGSGVNFNPQSYMGQFDWRNILDKACNPDGTLGFFRALYASGTKQIHPEFGFAIVHKRCPNDLELASCSYSYS